MAYEEMKETAWTFLSSDIMMSFLSTTAITLRSLNSIPFALRRFSTNFLVPEDSSLSIKGYFTRSVSDKFL
nr:hypothetical protein [Hydrogenobacter thermophilus]